MSRKEPNFLRVYIIPVLLLNIVLGVWSVVVTHGLSIYLGYAVIVTVSLYLYLLYLGRYFR
jgi:hypothetical protein